MDLKDKVAIITGGSSGIGKALSIGFAKNKVKVAILGRTYEKAENVKNIIEDMGGEALPIKCDVRNYEECENAVETVIERWHQIDILINNAGYSKLKSMDKIKVHEFRAILETNVLGVYNITHAVVPFMIKARSGTIITTGSLAAKLALPRWSAYGMSKASIIGFTNHLAAELKRYKINVNSIMPNMVDTPLLRRGLSDEDIERLRPMQPEELLPFYLFFCTKKGRKTTGQNIDVDLIKNTLKLADNLPEGEDACWKNIKQFVKENFKETQYREIVGARNLIDFLFQYEN